MATPSSSTQAKAPKRKADQALEQIQDLAFNINGWAFEVPVELYGEPTLVTARLPSSTPYRDAMAIARNSGLPESHVVIGLTKREREPPGPACARYLHIGWVPLNQEDVHTMRANSLRIVGIKNPPSDEILKHGGNLPLMVVAKISHSLVPTTTISLYALVCPVNGLCTPCMVAQNEVFYLSKFRDFSTNIADRKSNWTNLVAEASYKPEGNPRERHKRARIAVRDQANLTIPEVISFKKDVAILFSSFAGAHETSSFVEFFDVFQQLGESLLDRPTEVTEPEEVKQFMALVEEDHDYEFDSLEFVNIIYGLWPDVLMTAQEAENVRASIYRQQLSLSYRLLKPFLLEIIHQIHSAPLTANSDAGFDVIVRAALATAIRHCPAAVSPHPIIPSSKPSDILTRLQKRIRSMTLAQTRSKGNGDREVSGSTELDKARICLMTISRILAIVAQHNPYNEEDEMKSIKELLKEIEYSMRPEWQQNLML